MTLITSTATASQAQPKKTLVTRQDWLYAFSLTGCFLWLQWSTILGPTFAYSAPGFVRPHVIVLLTASVCAPVILVGIFAFSRMVAPITRIFIRYAFVALVVAHPMGILVFLMRNEVPERVALLGLLLVDGVFVFFGAEELIGVGKTVLKVLFPVSLLTIGLGVHALLTFQAPAGDFEEYHSAVSGKDSSRNLLVWMIFDELDGDLAFGGHPQAKSLTNFGEFRREAIFLEDAQAPNRATIRSIPALLTGRPVLESTPVNGPDLELHIEGASNPVRLSRESTVFTDAHNVGRSVAVVGFYHPYCRLFKDIVDDCYWTADAGVDAWERVMVGESYREVAVDLTEAVAPYLHVSAEERKTRVRKFQRTAMDRVLAAGQVTLASRPCSFILLHVPVPHPPFIFRATSSGLPEAGSYWNNLIAADEVLGQFRRTLEKNGNWDAATVIISSDHHWRSDKWRKVPAVWSAWGAEDIPSTGERVPWMIKLPGQHAEVDYAPHVNTLITRELIDHLLQNPGVSTTDLVKWLDGNRNRFDFPPKGPE